ncbi:EF-P 5-aminopentanol modification-associated protein YfmH [Paraclostridium sordellii]|uniref:EF-P 5-aminopentanol modification-associated protein YfmH n=1 Tax=Paraclostridium sordellii TaxID=1505 RepID=UPI0005DF247B|nr:pitrilysin family protein [Paeniclostridium sordellii]MCQ4697548.1 insulinase family protein [Paeniclostridium sordellii]MDU6480519.1 pitrilysin family protein [Paeniclostridium sordellii]CEN85004.1 peptidase [[Clostridium] sordellii] [Paeniclostridium sordellii]CEO12987.1 peptidase [[Clostridium] sordellii] [Paeniclostridium sordellii]CEP46832.1 peptidase [[Clostridium] sordellii] [Paeniclostridium sordellii]
MEKIVNDILKEEVYYEKLDNGLDVYFMPKKGFTKKFAVLATNYGSNDLEFIPINQTEKFKVNEGIAHFLEHKMFEQPDGGNAFDKFSKLGASANAYTNFTITAYLFSCTENFYESLQHLIDYVQTPYFTDENVEKEKGIIEQEIKMYNDDPDWNVYFNCLKAMYSKYPVNIDIAGTVDSIYKITKEELYTCYNTFYNPGNMILFVVGDVDAEKVMEIAKKSNHYDVDKLKNEIERFYPEEPKTVNEKEIVAEFPISMPMFNIGFKDSDVGMKGKELLRKEVITEILLDMILKRGSEIFEELYMSGLINDNFGCGFTSQVDYGYTLIGGESNEPRKVKDTIIKYINKYKEDGLSEDDFNRVKKKKMGQFIKYFDSVNFIANNFISYKFKGINLMDYLEVIKQVKFEEVEERLKNHLKEEYCSISIVEPK